MLHFGQILKMRKSLLLSLQCSIRVLVAILFLLDDVPLGVFLFSPVGERALLGVLLLGGTVDFVFGKLCLTRLCLIGSVLTVADNPVLVGAVSLEDLLLPPLLESSRDSSSNSSCTAFGGYCVFSTTLISHCEFISSTAHVVR